MTYETYAYGSSELSLVDTKSITFPTFLRKNGCMPNTGTNCVQAYAPVNANTSNLKNYSGDFNGDGITDVIAIFNTSQEDIECSTCYPWVGDCTVLGHCYEQLATTLNATRAIFIDLKRNATTSSFDAGILNTINTNTKVEVADFNGDGKSDIYIINTGYVSIFSLNNNNQLSLLGSLSDPGIKIDRPILYGDYNGDGKIDFCIPQTLGSDSWTFYFSNGITFKVITQAIGYPYIPSVVGYFYINGEETTQSLREVSFIPIEINGDGKTDILLQKNYTVWSSPVLDSGSPQVTDFYLLENKSFDGSSVLFTGTAYNAQCADVGRYPISVFTNHNEANLDLEYSLLTGNKIKTFKCGKDNKVDVLLKSITTGNGVKETITYKPLKNDVCGYNCNSVYYDSGNTENYPKMDIVVAPTFKVVTQIDKQSNTVHKKQQFMYYGAVSNFEGLGFLGFRAMMRTNWTDVAGTNLISTISKNNIGLRGANDTNYSILGFELPQNLTPTSNFITKTINTYNIDNTTGAFEEPLQTNKVFKLKNTKTEQFNGLEATSAVTTTEYDAVNDPTQSITQLKNGTTIVQTTVSTIGYVPATTSPTYVVGRPASKTNTITLTANQDVSTTEELYAYQDHLLTQVDKRSTNSIQTSSYVTENNVYDDWGNITKKTITYPGLQPRFTDYEYDTTTHRFLTKSYDIEHLATEFTYDMSSGVLLTEKLPCTTGDLTTTYEYDDWFKKNKIIDYLGIEKRILYQSGGTYTRIKTEADDDSESFEIFDDLGRKIRSGYININGIFSHVDYLYDIYDRNYKTSEPYLASDSASQWSETFYDGYGRVTQGKSFTGKTVTYAYSGLSTTMSENTTSGNPATTTTNKTKVSVKNAIGQVVSSTESTPMGAIGTIAYTYFANGGLYTTTFDGNVTKIEQDEWGRKKKLTDTSAGIYEYTYNGFGETLTEVTPNGTTTYTLDDYGKVTVKAINGNLTNSTATNTYDPTTKLLIGTEFKDFESNPAQPTTTNYTYEYDAFNKLIKTTENAPQALFERTTEFDDFGRSSTEYYKATNNLDGKFSDKKIKNTYLKGFHWQILEDGTNNTLWQTDLVNARGQLLTAQYGTLEGEDSVLGVEKHSYDDYGLPTNTSFRTQNGPNATPFTAPFMTLATTFSAQRGNLLSRNYSFYGTEENFLYDDLDRLMVWSTPLGDPAGSRSGSSQIYDNKGRILYNDLGEYKYDSMKPYRSTGLKITNPAVTAYYDARTPQVIAYNAFKRPVTIDELNQEKITFEYNANNDRSVMYYGDYQADKNLRKYRKFYSADGSMEIKRNIATGTVEFLTYIGGDGYSAPIVVKSDGTTQNYLYLHRDYQGTIVATSDGTGQVLEKRHFDAWGSLVKYAKCNTTTIPTTAGLMLLDRGYTGHEHLLGVGLINMNGRLYDPKLHRFLSPDNYVQDPSNTQSFNRYGYCWNNPLKYADYNGEVFWVPILVGAILGAAAGGAAYVAHAIQTGNWNWGQFGISVLGGAVLGAITGGVAPTSVFSASLGATLATGFVSGFMPAYGVQVGDWSFSVSPTIAFGNTMGIGASISVTYSSGDFSFSGGLGIMSNSNYNGFGNNSMEIRKSILMAYDDGSTGFSLGTNFWSGDFKQQTGVMGFRSGDFRFSYENDGFPFGFLKKDGMTSYALSPRLGDGQDRYRTAAATIGICDFSAGFNIFTGDRDQTRGESGLSLTDSNGKLFKHGYANEVGTPYRLGAGYISYGNYRAGINSERYISYPIQARFAHGVLPQGGFPIMNYGTSPYFQYRTKNIFTAW